jgi:hypothetical protein
MSQSGFAAYALARTFQCPACGAPAGTECQTPDGSPRARHTERIRLGREAVRNPEVVAEERTNREEREQRVGEWLSSCLPGHGSLCDSRRALHLTYQGRTYLLRIDEILEEPPP